MSIKCHICGSLTLPCKCGVTPYIYTQPSQGWVCPVCGAGNAPTTPQCFCKNNPTASKKEANITTKYGVDLCPRTYVAYTNTTKGDE